MKIRINTLSNQFNLVLLLILILTFLGSIWINVSNMRGYLSDQLEIHAQDTATSLGLSLGEPIQLQDEFLIQATINAIFDRGYYQKIELVNINNTVRYRRNITEQPEQVPEWFIQLFKLEAPIVSTEVSTGWTIGGILKVQSNTGIAYGQLWKNTLDSAHTTLFIFVLSLLLAYLVLMQIYKPIRAAAEQAKQIINKNFITINEIPKATELKQFVIAMNQMSSSIKNNFTQLTQLANKMQSEVYIDGLTQLKNKKALIQTFEAFQTSQSNRAINMVMLRLQGLETYNQKFGFEQGDKLILATAKALSENLPSSPLDQQNEIYRLSGSEFLILVHRSNIEEVEQYIQIAVSELSLDGEKITETDKVKIGAGIGSFNHDQSVSNLLYALDKTTSKALFNHRLIQTEDKNKPSNKAVSHLTHYKQIIKQILEQPDTAIKLKSQAVKSYTGKMGYDLELFSEFVLSDETFNTMDVFSVAERYGLLDALELAIFSKLITHIHNSEHAQKEKPSFAIKLSKVTLLNEHTLSKLFEILKMYSKSQCQSIVIEVAEHSIITNLAHHHLTLQKFQKFGCKICISRFSASIKAMELIQTVKPNVIKFDNLYTRQIETNPQSSYVISIILGVMRDLEVTTVAYLVESQLELEQLLELGFDCVQGYAVEKPKYLG